MAGPRWSHPIGLEENLSAPRTVRKPAGARPPALPPSSKPLISLDDEGDDEKGSQKRRRGSYLRQVTTLQTAAAPPWELTGLQARVPRRARSFARCALQPFVSLSVYSPCIGRSPPMQALLTTAPV